MALANSGAGYSGTPLAQKLGLKDGQWVLFVDVPEAQAGLMEARGFAYASQIEADRFGEAGGGYDVIHLFATARASLEALAQPMMDAIGRSGMIWVSWPKKAAKIATDITEDVIRDVVLPIGLVDIKVCAVDSVWSGLKLVIRKELR